MVGWLLVHVAASAAEPAPAPAPEPAAPAPTTGLEIAHGPGWVTVNGKDFVRSHERKEDGEVVESDTYTLLSVVGPIVSVREQWYYEGGAHPSYGTSFRALDALTGAKVSLRTLFTDDALFQALSADKVVREDLHGATPTTLDALLGALDGECARSMGPQLLEQFAFYEVDAAQHRVAVRIGVSHGCEVLRGTFTQIGVYLPIPPALSADLTAAAARHLLMRDVKLD